MAVEYRMKQAPGEAAEFQQTFERIVKALHPDYERNKLVRGIRLEYLRELLPGVFASHNVLCKKGEYFHGFCITLHRELAHPFLISPLVIGGRFDHNNTTKSAYFGDIEPNRKWPFGKSNFSDSHSYRKGWEGIVEKCTRVAEQKMLPNYLAKVKQYKEPLSHLLELNTTLDDIQLEASRGPGLPPCTVYPLDYDMPLFAQGYEAARDGRDKFCFNIIRAKPQLFDRVRKMRSLPDLIVTLRV